MSKLKRGSAVQPTDEPGFVGTARLARGGETKTLREGDIVLIDQPDLDHDRALQFVAARVRAVVSSVQASTGRYPNLGPTELAAAGITLIDRVGPEIFTRVRSGEGLRIDEGRIFSLKDNQMLGEGVLLSERDISFALGDAEESLATRLQSLTTNAADLLERERAMLLQGADVPRLPAELVGRPMVVVSRRHDWKSDLTAARRFIRDRHAVVIGVEGGADALLEAKIKPDVIVGEVAELSDAALSSGAIAVVLGSGDRGMDRLEKSGAQSLRFGGVGAAPDLGLILADVNDAPVIVEVGAPPNLVALLDHGAAEVASAFLTRLRASRKLIDAKAIAQVSVPAVSSWPIVLLALIVLLTMTVAVVSTPVGQQWWSDLTGGTGFGSWIEGLFS